MHNNFTNANWGRLVALDILKLGWELCLCTLQSLLDYLLTLQSSWVDIATACCCAAYCLFQVAACCRPALWAALCMVQFFFLVFFFRKDLESHYIRSEECLHPCSTQYHKETCYKNWWLFQILPCVFPLEFPAIDFHNIFCWFLTTRRFFNTEM